MVRFRLHTWLLLLLLFLLLGTARPAASDLPVPAVSGYSTVQARSALAASVGRPQHQRGHRETVRGSRAGSTSRDRGLAEDPSCSGSQALPAPRLRLRFGSARCAPVPPKGWMGFGASDLPPPASAD